MRKISIYTFSFLTTLCLLASCDKGFDEMNTNPIAVTSLNPAFLMNNAIVRSSFPGQTLVYETAIVQQMVSPNGGVLAGGNYNQDNRTVTWGIWQRYYREVMKPLVDILDKTRDNPSRSNLYQMARIWRAYASMVLTDTYGDIPYTQAGLGHLEENLSPVYDPQQAIYADILKELDEASAALDATKPIETSDVLYNGNVVKWKQLGYSLMLRAAMRLTKAEPNLAQTYVGKAVAGGVFQSNSDNAVIRHTELYTNDVGNTLNATEANNYYLAAPFVNYLKDNNDPRLASIAVRYVGAKSGPEQNSAIAGNPPAHVQLSRNPEVQIGMPMGYDNGSIESVYKSAGLASFYDYSQLDRIRMGSRFAPAFIVTYAQTQLLLAEAAVRNWVQGDAAELYANGIRAHMEQLASYGSSVAIAEEAIETYIQAHPLDATNALEQINTQYWVASFLNGPEAFANFRRSGYPALAPNPYPGRQISGEFIRRLTYSDEERSVNSANLQDAVNRQGPDNLDTRVWWDKQ